MPSKSSPAVTFAAPSCTTCASCEARRPRSRRSARSRRADVRLAVSPKWRTPSRLAAVNYRDRSDYDPYERDSHGRADSYQRYERPPRDYGGGGGYSGYRREPEPDQDEGDS